MHPPLPRSASANAPSQEALAMLARWLPQGPVSGGSPVAAIAEEEVRRMSGMERRNCSAEIGSKNGGYFWECDSGSSPSTRLACVCHLEIDICPSTLCRSGQCRVCTSCWPSTRARSWSSSASCTSSARRPAERRPPNGVLSSRRQGRL